MKKSLFICLAFSFLLSCKQGEEPVEEPVEEPYSMPCGCKDDWMVRESTCNDELVWDYPVKLFTEEWNQLPSAEERRAVCQIPEDILSSLSTEDLTDICMEYPLLVADFWSSHDRTLDSLLQNFNGIRELLQREDASKGLLRWYRCAMQNLSFLTGDASNVEKGWFTYKIHAAELLFTRCNAPDSADYVEIVQHLVCGYEKMPAYPESFGGYSLDVNRYSRAKVMFKIDERIMDEIPHGFENYLFTHRPIYDDEKEQIMIEYKQAIIAVDELSCRFIN
jgi:hypothetical protein